jgi:aminopeptidase N
VNGDALSPGVSEALARERAERIADVRYELVFTIPPERQTPVDGRAVIRYRLRGPSRTVLDFDGRGLRDCRVNGRACDAERVHGHLVIPAAATREGWNEISIAFTSADGPLNRRDGLLYSLFVPARAHLVFPSFDQPDLKACVTLTLEVPAGWMAAANGAELERTPHGRGWRLRFAETRPIPTYLVAFIAGLLGCETIVRGRRTFRLWHHAVDPADVARACEVIADLHVAALDGMERYTDRPYFFGRFDIMLVPSFQFGGMEHPGLVYYDAARLLLPPAATATQCLERASLIAHETAHMWFGNLVTMRWFSDVWLKEVFANLMAARLVEPLFPGIDHRTRMLLAHHPEAARVDRSEGTHPIRQRLDNLQEAGQLYGPLVYQKSVIAMRQLEAWVGADVFQAAVRAYLGTHAFGNASWPDLLAILSATSGRDLRAWNTWFEEAGRPEMATDVRLGAAGRVEAIDLVVRDPHDRGRHWPQVLPVAIGHGSSVREVAVPVDASRVPVPGIRGLSTPVWVLPGGSEGYGLFRLDAGTRRFLLGHVDTIGDACTRARAWVTLWENVLAGDVEPSDFVAAVVRALPREREEQTVERVLAWAVRACWRLLSGAERMASVVAIEALLRREIETAPTVSRAATCFAAFRDVACSTPALAWLIRVWSREETVPGLPLAEADEVVLALELAVRGIPDADRLLQAQLQRVVQPDRREALVFVMPALSGDPAGRDAAFERLRDAAHRRREPWALQSLRYLNHPLRQDHARRFVVPGLGMMTDIQRTGDIFFPARWAEALLWGHQTPEAADLVRRFLRDEPSLPVRLRRLVLVAADELFRAARRFGSVPHSRLR